MSADHVKIYAAFLRNFIKLSQPFKIVVDASNGTAGVVAKALFEGTIVEAVCINDEVHPDFPAHGPNPMTSGASRGAAKKILETKAQMGVMFDADGDRIFLIDEKGLMLPSYATAYLLFKGAKPPYVVDELVFKALEQSGLYNTSELFPSKVGSFYIKDKLRDLDAEVAAELSGPFYFKDSFGLDSGMMALIKILNQLSVSSFSLGKLAAPARAIFVKNEDIKIKSGTWNKIEQNIREAYTKKTTIAERDGLTLDFGKKWLNIRPSNTEPLIRLTAGSATSEEAFSLIENLKKYCR